MKNTTISRLKRYFLLSTAIPFFLIVVITSTLITRSDREDLSIVTKGYLESISENISGYFKDLRQITILPYFSQGIMSNIIQISKDDYSYSVQIDLESQLNSLLSSIRYTTNDFYSAILVKGDSVLYSSHTGLNVNASTSYPYSQTDWYKVAMEAEESIIYFPPHLADYYIPDDGEERISLLTTIKNLYSREPYAVLKIDVLPSFFDKYLENVEFHLPSCVFITDEQNRIIYSTGKSQKMLDRLSSITNENKIVVGELPKATTYAQRIPNTVYTLKISIDNETLFYKSMRIYAMGIGFYLLAIVIAFSLYKATSSRVTEPIEEMRRVLEEVSKGNFSARYQYNPKWDLSAIGDIVNSMVEDLEVLINKNYIAELEKVAAENRALMSQIQPHFLFNTLNSIISLIYEERVEEATDCLFSLSNLLHYVLKMDNTVTLKEESNFLKDYLTLQKTRFNDRLDWTIDIDRELYNIVIPRLILQPFVENSVVHGTEPTNKLCHITITGKLENDILILKIVDDGTGFDPEKTNIYSSIGVSNSVNRLKLLYENSSVDISSSPGCGCEVIIMIKGDSNEHLIRR